MPKTEDDCVFCRIISQDIPADLVHADDRVVAFRDQNPQAPMHLLVVPAEHHQDIAATAGADPSLAGELMAVAANLATSAGYPDYRLVTNTGRGAGQSVFHAHVHVLAGRPLRWPPG